MHAICYPCGKTPVLESGVNVTLYLKKKTILTTAINFQFFNTTEHFGWNLQ